MEMRRSAQSSKEIEALPPAGTTGRDTWVREHLDSYCPETLVYLLRAYGGDSNTAMFEVCAAALVGVQGHEKAWRGGHCERIICSVIRGTDVAKDVLAVRAFRRRCHDAMWLAVLAGSDKKPFWEVRFGRAFKDRCLDELRAVQREEHRGLGGLQFEPLPEQDAIAGEERLDEAVFHSMLREDLLKAIRRLPDQQAEIAYLHYFEDLPITSRSGRSISRLLRLSESYIHRVLKRAEAGLRQDPTVQKYRDR